MKLRYGPYSPSRLETAICGYSFWNQYVKEDRKRGQENLPQARGSAVHEVFEKITAKLIAHPDGTSFSAQEIRNWINEAVDAHPAAYEEAGEILNMCKLYVQRPPRVLTSDAGIELRLAVKAFQGEDGSIQFKEADYEDPDAFFRGRADILVMSDDLTTAIVYDHKTQPNTEEADTFQMGCYAWVIWKIHPYLKEIKSVLHFARYGSYSEEHTWTLEALQAVEDELLTRIQIVDSRTTWEATPNKLCQYCPMILKCPAMEEFIQIDPNNGNFTVAHDNFKCLGDTNKAVKLAGLVNVLEEVVKKSKAELRTHVKAFGPVAIPGKLLEFRGVEGIHWDRVNKHLRKEIYAVFEEHGVNPRDFMLFNQTASAAAMFVDNPALIKKLSEVLPRKVTTTFKGYKL